MYTVYTAFYHYIKFRLYRGIILNAMGMCFLINYNQ